MKITHHPNEIYHYSSIGLQCWRRLFVALRSHNIVARSQIALQAGYSFSTTIPWWWHQQIHMPLTHPTCNMQQYHHQILPLHVHTSPLRQLNTWNGQQPGTFFVVWLCDVCAPDCVVVGWQMQAVSWHKLAFLHDSWSMIHEAWSTCVGFPTKNWNWYKSTEIYNLHSKGNIQQVSSKKEQIVSKYQLFFTPKESLLLWTHF